MLIWLLPLFGFALVLSLIGAAIVATRGTPVGRNAKIECAVVGVLQIIHIVLYVTSAMAKLYYSNAVIALIISIALAAVCFGLSVWLFFPKADCHHGIKYLLLFVSLIQIFAVLVTFVFSNNSQFM